MREQDWADLESVLETLWIQDAKREDSGASRIGIEEFCGVLSACFDPSVIENDTASSHVNVLKNSAMSPDSTALVRAVRKLGLGNIAGWKLSRELGLMEE